MKIDKPSDMKSDECRSNKEVNTVQHVRANGEQQMPLALLKLISLSEHSLSQNGEITLDEAFDV